ncbi:MAG: hypothetical protein SH820_08310 [Xanthomonadales bacterium]|nr:hypothetical protein [Xanthomonadales bacterium]
MDDKLLIALIAGSSALLGSLVPTVDGYVNSKKQRAFEIQKTLLDRQRQIYSDLMLSLQEMINSQTNAEHFLALQRAVLQVAIYGDNATSVALNEYYTAIFSSTQPGGTPLKKEKHQVYQKRVLNGMRAHLGLQPLPLFEIVSFRPQSNQTRT